jgi:Protein of unknown function (DUF3089)
VSLFGRLQIMQPGCLYSEKPPRRTGRLALIAPAIVLTALVAASCSSPAKSASGTSSTTSATSAPTGGSTTTVWLCKPGVLPDPCEYANTATSVAASGAESPAAAPTTESASTASGFDCFYVYPTVSSQAAGNSGNTNLTVGSSEIAAAAAQASPFSRVCNVWAPMYRSETTQSIEEGLGGNTALLDSTFAVAYDSLLSAWNDFMANDNDGRPVILIGDSQGSAILIHLIATQLDNQPSVLGHLVVAIIAGGNLQVPGGKSVGATFSKVPLCTSATETGCAIAWSSFPSEPPADSLFGRPGQGVSLQSGQTTAPGDQVACVNPAALAGGTADLSPYFITATQKGLRPKPATHWVTYPDLYSAMCESSGGATWLQVTDIAQAGDTRPLVTESLGPTWGYHADDTSLAMGNLLQDVTDEEAAWSAAHG